MNRAFPLSGKKEIIFLNSEQVGILSSVRDLFPLVRPFSLFQKVNLNSILFSNRTVLIADIKRPMVLGGEFLIDE